MVLRPDLNLTLHVLDVAAKSGLPFIVQPHLAVARTVDSDIIDAIYSADSFVVLEFHDNLRDLLQQRFCTDIFHHSFDIIQLIEIDHCLLDTLPSRYYRP